MAAKDPPTDFLMRNLMTRDISLVGSRTLQLGPRLTGVSGSSPGLFGSDVAGPIGLGAMSTAGGHGLPFYYIW
jgi:hypothetical protein